MTPSSPESFIINGVTYVREGTQTVKPAGPGPTQIIVADKNFCFVGNVSDNDDGSVTITNTKNIRYWGTTKGLGELSTGPTAKTLVDDWGTVKVTPILRIAVTGGWK